MKIKLLAVVTYVAFVVIGVFHWYRLGAAAANWSWALEGTRHAAQNAVRDAKSLDEAKVVVAKTVARFDAFERVKEYQKEEARAFVYLAFALTLPLVVLVTRDVRNSKPA